MEDMTVDQAASIREDVVVLLARASGAALRTANAALEPFGFRARHYATVKIAAEGGGVPQRQIGAVLGLDPSAVVALVDDLESLGLVSRQPDPDDLLQSCLLYPSDAADDLLCINLGSRRTI